VPERIGDRALVAGAALPRQRRPRRTEVVEKLLDPTVADHGDLAPAQFGCDALGIPVRVQAHRDHDLFDPRGVTEHALPRSAPLGSERGQTAAPVRALP